MEDPVTGATGEAMADVIGEIFTFDEANLDGQMLEMASGNASYQEAPPATTSDTNANTKDEGLDAALIDLLPF